MYRLLVDTGHWVNMDLHKNLALFESQLLLTVFVRENQKIQSQVLVSNILESLVNFSCQQQ